MQASSMKEHFKPYFDIGAAVNTWTIDSHADLLRTHFSSLTCENEMKFSNICKGRGIFDFDRADKIVDFAQGNGMKMRGHTLLWHQHAPDWVFVGKNGNATRDEVLEILTEHINTVLGRYKGRVYCYDAVNEAVSDEGGAVLRPTKWSEVLGDNYLDDIFHIAHRTDPAALLFYNDYSEVRPDKRDKIIGLVKGMLDRGVPIHGVGLQAHWSIFYPTADLLREGLEKYAKLGLRLHITEMDVSVFQHEDRRIDLTEPEPGMIEKVAAAYEMAFRIFKEYHDVIDNVTTWGVADDCTWLDSFPVRGRKNWPLMFGTDHKLKVPGLLSM